MAQPKLADELRQRVLSLPASDRLALAAEIVGSVEATDPEWDQAWVRELQRRSRALDSGTIRGIPWPEARAELDAMLRRFKP